MSKKILFVCDSLGGGGAERQLALLATWLREPWRVSVFALGGGLYADRLRTAGIPLVVSPRKFRFDVSPIIPLCRHIGALKPDVVHSWGWMSAYAAEACCRQRKVPHLSGVIRCGTVLPRRAQHLRIAASLGKLTVANSRAGLDAFGIGPDRGRVLYNGFDPARLALGGAGAPPRDAFNVVMAATMDDRKDFALFVRTARELVAGGKSQAVFTALGSGPDSSALAASAKDLIDAGRCRFPGRVDEVLHHYGSAHAGVLLSTHGEGLSNSIMEYMAAGLPVVCTDEGGSRELVVDGVTGFLIPPADAAVLAEKLLWLENHRDEAEAMGRAGRRRIEVEFSVERMIVRAGEIYSEALA